MALVIDVLLCVGFGVWGGWLLAQRKHPDQVDRFFMLDQQIHERREGYYELAERLGEQRQ